MARGTGSSVEQKTVSPCEDVLLSHPKDQHAYGSGLRKSLHTHSLLWGGDGRLTCWCGATTIERLADSVGRYGHEDPHLPKTT
jgi:hypothetical protein